MSHLKHSQGLIPAALALVGLPLGCVLVLAAGGTGAPAQDPAGRGQAPAAARTSATDGHNLTLPNFPNPYRTIENIVTMPAGRNMGSTNAINVDSKGNIWVFERCGGQLVCRFQG